MMGNEIGFKNPVVKKGADPWVILHEGFYYYCFTGHDCIYVTKASELQDIGNETPKKVWSAPKGTLYSLEMWAPELHYIKGKWYIYFAADDGNNDNHRMYVVASKDEDALSEYTLKGKIYDPSDKWAIDGTVLKKNEDELYFIWSGWEGDINVCQNLYIAPMSNPWTINGERVLISTPERDWELNGNPLINEGPEVLIKDDKIHIVYSASGSWCDDYCLGILTCNSVDVLDSKSWVKNGPVFSKVPTAYGPGHASFTVSKDGTKNYIVYHACEISGGGWAGRSVRIQEFKWSEDGLPIFGTPEKLS